MMESSEKEICWLAGLLEGEGCFYTVNNIKKGKTSRPSLLVSLRMTDKDILEKVAVIAPSRCSILSEDPNKLPSTILLKKISKNSKKRKIIYTLRWNGDQAENLMRRIYPLMGNRRKEKFDQCFKMEFSHHTKHKQPVRND